MNPRRNNVLPIVVVTIALGAVAAAIVSQRGEPNVAGTFHVPSAESQNGERHMECACYECQSQQSPVVTDKPITPVLINVSISPEARVKATATEGRRDLRQGAWSEFTITIDNAAGITAPLVVESEQLMTSDDDTSRDHWLSLSLEPSGPLTGAPTETRILRLRSRDPGIRTAVLNINAGQGTQDLGFRSDVIISFHISPARQATPFVFRSM